MTHAPIAIPNAAQCLHFAAPVLATMAAWWLYGNLDQIIAWLFPSWEWEKKLGWLNIRANRRAEAVLRWIGYVVHALLAFALYGIVRGATGFADIAQMNNPNAVADGMGKLSLLLTCLGFWLVYLGCELIPKLHRQYEREDLEKYRAEFGGLEDDDLHPRQPVSPLSPSKLDIWSKRPFRARPEERRRRY